MAPAQNLPETRDGFRFRGGHLALDLTATLAGRLKERPRDLLAEPSDLSRWLCASGLAREVSSCDVEALAAARRLREAIYLLARARLAGAKPPAAARRLVNRIAATPSAPPRLDATGTAARSGDARAFLSHLAREAIDLVAGEAGDRIHQCGGAGCAILFLDTSRTGARRWCSMAACGNRHKVAELRRRQRGAA